MSEFLPSSFVKMRSKQEVLDHFESLLKQSFQIYFGNRSPALPEIETFLNLRNTFPESLQIPDSKEALHLNQWCEGSDPRTLEKSKAFLVQGKMIFWLLWAGEASRAEQILQESESYIYDKHGKPISTKPSKVFFQGNSFDPDLPKELNLAVRQMLQRRLDLERLGGEETLKRTPFIIHINQDNKVGVLELFRRYDFFGFNPDLIVFIIQDGIEGWTFQNGWKEYGQKRPGGHGYPLLQLSWKNQGFTLNSAGTERPIVGISPLEYFDKSELLCAFPVEDNKLLQSAFDVKRLAAVQTLLDENPKRILVLEAILNLKGQKGGAFLQKPTTGECVMVEKLQLQTPEHQHLFLNPQKMPLLNRNITYIKVKEFQKAIQHEGMYFTFNSRDPGNKGTLGFWPDLVTCIISQSPAFLKSGVFYEEGLAIENFKSEADVPLLLKRFHEQMQQSDFQELWKKL
ncbi:MAG: hypothetical protein AABZ60_19135 [Planctomycetota bacterium]